MDFLKVNLDIELDNREENFNESEQEMYLEDLANESQLRFATLTALHTFIAILIVTSLVISIVIATKTVANNIVAIERRIRDFFRPLRYLRYDRETLWRTRTRTAISLMNAAIWNSDVAWRYRIISRVMLLVKAIIHKIKFKHIHWLLKKITWKKLLMVGKVMITVSKYLPEIFNMLIIILIINVAVTMIILIVMILFTLWIKHSSSQYYLDDDD